jgi:hypothetical protein
VAAIDSRVDRLGVTLYPNPPPNQNKKKENFSHFRSCCAGCRFSRAGAGEDIKRGTPKKKKKKKEKRTNKKKNL